MNRPPIGRLAIIIAALVALPAGVAGGGQLPWGTVFKGESKFAALLARAAADNWAALPIGDRTAAVGRALVGTPYKNFTLEIDDRIEAPSVNFEAMDCWTFFEISLAFARLLDEPPAARTPQQLLEYIERDRYRGGHCTGEYLSRLHYLEDWFYDNGRRGLIKDLTPALGGVRMRHVAREMSVGWQQYRYLRANPALRAELARHEARVTAMKVVYIPKSRVPGIEAKLADGDVIAIVSRDGDYLGTSHVGLAVRDPAGVLRFMHASSPRNYGRAVIDSRLSAYLNRFSSHAGIMVARPLR